MVIFNAKKMRGETPFVFTDLKEGLGIEKIEKFIMDQGVLYA